MRRKYTPSEKAIGCQGGLPAYRRRRGAGRGAGRGSRLGWLRPPVPPGRSTPGTGLGTRCSARRELLGRAGSRAARHGPGPVLGAAPRRSRGARPRAPAAPPPPVGARRALRRAASPGWAVRGAWPRLAPLPCVRVVRGNRQRAHPPRRRQRQGQAARAAEPPGVSGLHLPPA